MVHSTMMKMLASKTVVRVLLASLIILPTVYRVSNGANLEINGFSELKESPSISLDAARRKDEELFEGSSTNSTPITQHNAKSPSPSQVIDIVSGSFASDEAPNNAPRRTKTPSVSHTPAPTYAKANATAIPSPANAINEPASSVSNSEIELETPGLLNSFLVPSQPDTNVTEILKQRVRTKRRNHPSSPLDHCSPTSQVRIQQYADNHWSLVSLNATGHAKTIGGDEYYITYKDALSSASKPVHTLVAAAKDNRDGTYSLHFSTTPMNPRNTSGRGDLTVHLIYTCGIGAMGQPSKDMYLAGATCDAHWSYPNVTTPAHDTFEPPITDINLSKYNLVIGYGDSLMEGLMLDKLSKKQRLYRPNTTVWGGSPESELHNGTVDGLMTQLGEWHGHQLNQSNVALLVGSAAWDLLSRTTVDPGFSKHLLGVRDFVERLRLEYPSVDLYWRSAAAFQPQSLPASCAGHPTCKWRTRYLANSRAYEFYEKQRDLVVKELGVPFLDFWNATYLSGDHTLYGTDGRHYSTSLNKMMMGWFYQDDADES